MRKRLCAFAEKNWAAVQAKALTGLAICVARVTL